jgi:hypothetical protein
MRSEDRNITDYYVKQFKRMPRLGMMAHTCNSTFSGGGV